jgi:Glycosyltransferase family 87
VLGLLALFVWAVAGGRDVLGGAALGVATALRFHPALFIAWLVWRQRWRACAVACLTALACTALATATVGWAPTVEYLTRVAPQYGYGALTGQLGNLSVPGWIVATGHGLLPSLPLGGWRIVGMLAAAVALATAVLVLRPWGSIAPERLAPELGFVALVLLLITPNTTINHLVFTLLPLGVLIESTLRDGRPGRAAWLAAALVLIASVDDYYQHPRLATGLAVLLAGIKTYGLVVLAALMLPLLRRPVVAPARHESIVPAAHEYAHGAPR